MKSGAPAGRRAEYRRSRAQPASTLADAVRRRRRLLVQVETLFETVHTSAGVDQLLLTGKERMALAANLNADVLFGRARLKGVAAGALDGGHLVFGMDLFLHRLSHLASQKQPA